MNFKINKKNNNTIEVLATITGRKYSRDPHCTVNTNNILDFLVSEGYNLGEWKVTQSDLCTTGGKTQRLTGTWILERKADEQPKQQSTTSAKQRRATRSRKKKTPELLRNENVGRVQSQAQTSLRGQDKKIQG